MDRYLIFSLLAWQNSSCAKLAPSPRQSIDGLEVLFSIPATATDAEVQQWQAEGGTLYTADEIRTYLAANALRWERPL